REKRMEHAIDLLRSGNSNVTETAFAVGYNNVSHFSELFRKKYGMNPSKLLRIY
ncbi:TPA: helix-turn-helix transcriptional regulator, partial [Bacillus wiedmannii]|nr:helix-turn-helix transcriptional regulator [Bacillus wiedmannii]